MKLQELYVINDALGGEDIFGLPSFKAVEMPRLRVRQIKEGLVKKGVCDTINTLSLMGERMVKALMRYKEVDTYVQIGAVTLALIDSIAAIMQQYNPQEEEYTFSLISLADIPALICEAYPFMRDEMHTAKLEKTKLSGKEFENRFALDHSNSFYISVWQSGIEISSEVFFGQDSTLYIYNQLRTLLCSKTASEMQNTLLGRLSAGNAPLSANAV